MNERETSDSDADLLDSLIGRLQEGAAERLDRQMSEAGEFKAREEASSQSRLEEMWVREHARQQAIAQAQAEQRQQERQLMRYAVIGAVVLIFIIVVLALVLSRAGGDTTPQGLPLLLNAYA